MATPNEIIDAVSALQNDTAQAVYTNAACLPYLNIALDDLQEIFELNNVPTTNETSGTIAVPANTSSIGFDTTPALPANLVEIQELFESPTGQDIWTPITKKEFLTNTILGTTKLTTFGVWAWINQEIRFRSSSIPIDIKLDYIQSIFPTPISINAIDVNIPIRNVKTYLGFKTAALCSMFIGENETRAMVLDGLAGGALQRSLGISVKGRQSIVTRRRPFRAAFKRRRTMI